MVVRVIEVPRMTSAELKETMKWEVERHIPFSAADVEMDYRSLDDPSDPATANNPNMEVLLAVAQRDMVNSHLEILEAAGLKPVAIDVEPLAAGRSLINLNKTGLLAKNIVIVNIGAANTDVGVFRNGVLRFPRPIPIAGDTFTSAIANGLGLSYEAAEEEKRQYGAVLMDLIGGGAGANDPFAQPTAGSPFDFDMSTPFDSPVAAPPSLSTFDMPLGTAETTVYAAESPFAATVPALEEVPGAIIPDDPRQRRRREIFDAILPTLGEFSMELRRSVDYFRSKYPNDAIDQILLCGGSAVIENLDQFIQSDLGIPTKVGNPFEGLNVTSKQVSAERLMAIAPSFAVAVGLAARDAILGSDG